MIHSVYVITNRRNESVYFGMTEEPVHVRWSAHLRKATEGRSPLQKAIMKYGAAAFHVDTLSTHDTRAQAEEEERGLITENRGRGCYNVADGGDGGLTLTKRQMEDQYGIGPDRYVEFMDMFDGGVSAKAMASSLGVGRRSLVSCATRLGASFAFRRAAKPRSYVSRARLTAEDRTRLRSEVAARNNRSRRTPVSVESMALSLYFNQGWSAQDVSDELGITRARVRAAVWRCYESVTAHERTRLKRLHIDARR